ncbi:MAG: ATP-binding protein [Muribaculaceae bacterium]|nr:ATP-binding protein [Muribaculaceae bacterium]
MTNSPFQYGSLAEKENFIDRVEDRALLKQLLMNGIHVMLISPRRWGKSSLVKVATDELVAENKNVRVCHIDAFSISSETEFYRTFASKVMSCAASKFEKGLKEMKNFLNAAVPQLVLKDDVTEFLTFDIRFKPQEQEKLEILQLPEKIAASKGLRIIVCIDEFQQLARIPQYADMEGKMRSVWQRQHHVSYCFYGSKRHMMTDIFNDSSKPFYRFGQVIWLKKIEAKYWIDFIVEAFRKTGKSISPLLAQRVCDITKCHSWYVQQFCFFIWNATEHEVSEQIFQAALQRLIDTNAPMFQNDMDQLTSSQKAMLHAVNEGVKQLSSADAKQLYDLGNANTIARNKRILQDRDIIEIEGETFVFVDPIFQIWFTQQERL